MNVSLARLLTPSTNGYAALIRLLLPLAFLFTASATYAQTGRDLVFVFSGAPDQLLREGRLTVLGTRPAVTRVHVPANHAIDDTFGLKIGGLFIGYESRMVDFGMTSSITFKRITLGMGWNMFGAGAKAAEGTLFERRGFMVIGGTFNLALP